MRIMNERYPAGTIFIDLSTSQCNNCGGQCLPRELFHDTDAGYGGKGKGHGCKVTFTHISSNYAGDHIKEAAMKLRPDLPWLPRGYEIEN